MNYTYILRCADDTLYCGWTNHLEKRIKAHNEGKGAKYTKTRRPVALAYFEEFDSRQEAMKREAAIKKMSRKEKLKLFNEVHKSDRQISGEC
jgi:putative endonuclease